jgi:ribosome-associated toxin RatA of RatAB toxin-antitoxin module
MREVHRSALVGYSADRMFALVNDVSAYPEFLPWCAETVVHEAGERHMRAEIAFSKAGVSKRFTTENRLSYPESIEMRLVDGPFENLYGTWLFRPLSEEACKISLDIAFRIRSRVLDLALGRAFEQACDTLVDAFTRRARQVYG